MAITHTWGISKVRVMPTPQTDFISVANWYVDATDSESEFTGRSEGSMYFTEEGDTFIPYADLTEAQVVGWVKERLDDQVVGYEQAATNQIESKKTPPVTPTNKVLPWAAE